MAEREKLIEVNHLSVTFGKKRAPFRAVDDVSFHIYKGETFGLVGESGSGKTTIGRAIIRINPTSGGDVLFHGQKINGPISRDLDSQVIRKIQMIFQDPMASLNERAKVDYIVSEGLYSNGRAHLHETGSGLSGACNIPSGRAEQGLHCTALACRFLFHTVFEWFRMDIPGLL